MGETTFQDRLVLFLHITQFKGFGILSFIRAVFIFYFNKKWQYISQNELKTNEFKHNYKVRSDQSLSRVRPFATPWIAACQASLSITNSRSSLRPTSTESVMPSRDVNLFEYFLSINSDATGCFVFWDFLMEGKQNWMLIIFPWIVPF